MMSGLLWEDDSSFSSARVKMEPLDDIDGGTYCSGMSGVSGFGDFILTSPIKSEPQWFDNGGNNAENTSFDSGYTSSSQDILNQRAIGVSIDPDFVQESPKKICVRKTFAKIERGGRLSDMTIWSPIKLQPHEDFTAYGLVNDFVFEPNMCNDVSEMMSSKAEDSHVITAQQCTVKTKRKYTRRTPLKKQTAKSRKSDEQNEKPSKRVDDARNRFDAALFHADSVSKVRHRRHMETLENMKVTKEQTAKAAYLLNKCNDSKVRKIRRVIFQENQKLQGERFSWSVGDSINKSFKHISVKKGVKRKRGATSFQARRQAMMDGSESD
jgi:Mor family transcriptional regulator